MRVLKHKRNNLTVVLFDDGRYQIFTEEGFEYKPINEYSLINNDLQDSSKLIGSDAFPEETDLKYHKHQMMMQNYDVITDEVEIAKLTLRLHDLQ